MVKSHQEYAMQAWNPHQLGDIRKIESVQRRFTRLIHIHANLEEQFI